MVPQEQPRCLWSPRSNQGAHGPPGATKVPMVPQELSAISIFFMNQQLAGVVERSAPSIMANHL
ncbi:hypothetical protein ACRRTK_011261 [Alexandromys fortis]